MIDVITEFRENMHWSQEDLGNRLGGLSQQCVGNYERRKRIMPVAVAKRFVRLVNSHGYQYTLDDVYSWVDERAAA